MIEIAEAYAFSKQMNHVLRGLSVVDVQVLMSPHKFCWLTGDNSYYEEHILGNIIKEVKSSAHHIRIMFEDGYELTIAEDVNLEYKPLKLKTNKHQLSLTFNNDDVLEFKVKLYGFIYLGNEHTLKEHYPYYEKAIDSIFPTNPQFTYDYFIKQTGLDQNKGSIKAALATNQHIVGLGNGTLQDILFDAKLSPKRKVVTLLEQDKRVLYESIVKKIDEMIVFGGRNQVLNMFGEKGGYEVIMSHDRSLCPVCQNELKKEAFMGGKVIYCPVCQK